MSKFLIVANWKEEPQTLHEARRLFSAARRGAARSRKARVVVCPPHVYLSAFLGKARAKTVAFGSQDLSFEMGGAHTGEVSSFMLKNLGVEFSLVGHSERRARGENNEIIAKKIKAARIAGITPIVCVGESERDQEGKYLQALREQLKHSFSSITKTDIRHMIIAYEPVWAIGEKAKAADTPEGTLEIVIFIKKVLADIFGKKNIMSLPILYGGSVNDKNAGEFLSRGGVQGLLVGRASLNTKTFGTIIKMAEEI